MFGWQIYLGSIWAPPYIRADADIDDDAFELEFGRWPTQPKIPASFRLPFGGTHTFTDPPTIVSGTNTCGETKRELVYIRCATTEIGRLFFFDVNCDGRSEEYDLYLPIEAGHDARLRIRVSLTTICGGPP